MGARDDFVETMRVLSDCLSNASVIDKAPSDIQHNLQAKIYRQGLAVLLFSAMETFMRERVREVFGELSKALKFNDLSDGLQSTVTIGALAGINFRIKLQDKATRIAWLAAQLAPIAKIKVGTFSELSFGYATSNLVEDDVKNLLKAFGVIDPWAQMTRITSRVGSAVADCQAEFIAIKKRRHSSAHALSANVLYIDLYNSLRSALSICLAFDLLISQCRGSYNRKIKPAAVTQADLALVFVNPRPTKGDFSVVREVFATAPFAKTVIRVFPTLPLAEAYAIKYSSKRRRHLIFRDGSLRPARWVTW